MVLRELLHRIGKGAKVSVVARTSADVEDRIAGDVRIIYKNRYNPLSYKEKKRLNCLFKLTVRFDWYSLSYL
jgi:hypothetical protein